MYVMFVTYQSCIHLLIRNWPPAMATKTQEHCVAYHTVNYGKDQNENPKQSPGGMHTAEHHAGADVKSEVEPATESGGP